MQCAYTSGTSMHTPVNVSTTERNNKNSHSTRMHAHKVCLQVLQACLVTRYQCIYIDHTEHGAVQGCGESVAETRGGSQSAPEG
jgi:hypothetical protein